MRTTFKKIEVIILVIFIVAVFIFAFYKNMDTAKKIDSSINNTPITAVEDSRLIIPGSYETKIMNISDDYSTFDIKYPYFSNASDEFNGRVKTFLEQQVKDQQTNSKEGWQARYDTQTADYPITKTPSLNDKWPFQADYTVVQSNNNYISYVLQYGGFTGGAHGFESKVSFNYNVVTKNDVTLKELFPNNPDYLKYLSDESRKQLVKRFATMSKEDKANSTPEAIKEYIDNMMSDINTGTELTESNFNVFTFTPNKVKIYFAQYQVGPYVIGMPEVEVDRK